MLSAAVSASVASNTASTWLGPSSIFQRQQRQAQRLRRVLHDAQRLLGQVVPGFGSRL
jgi:hypothetical protein